MQEYFLLHNNKTINVKQILVDKMKIIYDIRCKETGKLLHTISNPCKISFITGGGILKYP